MSDDDAKSDPSSYRVDIKEHPRGGNIEYIEGPLSAKFWWRPSAGKYMVASITIPFGEAWTHETPWPEERRAEIAERVARALIARLDPDSEFEFNKEWIRITKGETDQRYLDSLPEETHRKCRKPECTRNQLRFRRFCKVHEFEEVKGRPYPFDT